MTEDINKFVTAIIDGLQLWRGDTDYQSVEKIYGLYEMNSNFDIGPHSLRHVHSQ